MVIMAQAVRPILEEKWQDTTHGRSCNSLDVPHVDLGRVGGIHRSRMGAVVEPDR